MAHPPDHVQLQDYKPFTAYGLLFTGPAAGRHHPLDLSGMKPGPGAGLKAAL